MSCACGNAQESSARYLAPLQSIFSSYSDEESSLIPILQDAQDQYGYLPQDVLKAIAAHLGLSLGKVYGVVTFYSQFHLKPRGRNVIRVCTGTACHVRGGAEVLKAIEKKLGITAGGTTTDLEFTLETVACIGACGLAPVMMVNDDTHGRLTPETVGMVLDAYRSHSGAVSNPAAQGARH